MLKVVGLLDIIMLRLRHARYSKSFRAAQYSNIFGLIDIQTFQAARLAARYLNFSSRSIFKKLSGFSIFKVFGLLEIQTVRSAPHSNFVGWSKEFGLLDIHSFRAARNSKYSACSIFSLFGPLGIQSEKLFGIQTFQGCQSILNLFRLLDILTFRAAQYLSFSGRSRFRLFGLLGIQTFRAARYSNFSGRSMFIVFGLLDVQPFRHARYSKSSGCWIF